METLAWYAVGIWSLVFVGALACLLVGILSLAAFGLRVWRYIKDCREEDRIINSVRPSSGSVWKDLDLDEPPEDELHKLAMPKDWTELWRKYAADLCRIGRETSEEEFKRALANEIEEENGVLRRDIDRAREVQPLGVWRRKYCFRCRKHVHCQKVLIPAPNDYLEPTIEWRCPTCWTDSTRFPGWD